MVELPFSRPIPSSVINGRRVTITKAELRSQRKLTHDTFEIKVACSGKGDLVGASSGQFATLLFPGLSRPRPYSFARDPVLEAEGQYTFYIRLVPGGKASTWISNQDRTGTVVEMAGPLGNFGLDDSTNTILCIGGGSGISAIKALVEKACRLQVKRDCLFFYGARTQADLYCEPELMEIRNLWHRDHKFIFVQVLSGEDDESEWSGARGQVVDYIENNFSSLNMPAWSDISGFLCGPGPMVNAGRSLLERKGVSKNQIYADVFEDASSPAPTVDNSKCVLCDECLLVKPIENCIIEASGSFREDEHFRGFETINPGLSSGLYYNTLFIDPDKCIRCHACVSACPHDAISVGVTKPIRTLRRSGPPLKVV